MTDLTLDAPPQRASARMMRRFLWLQLAGAIGVSYACARWLNASPAAAVALGAAAVVLVRLLISANNFRISRRFSAPAPPEFRLSPRGALYLFWSEFKASMLATSWFMLHARPVEHIYPDSRHLPVLLLHGYGCNSGYWARLLPRLERARISHATLDLEPLFGSIEAYVPAIEQAVAALCRRTGAGQVIIVAHSMGGLAARAWLRAQGARRAAHVLTLGTPHHGTRLAGLGAGVNARQMVCGSPWLAALAASEDAPRRALITSLYTWHDNIIAPQDSSVLEGARNIGLGGVGHVALAHEPRVLALILDLLHQISAQEK
jgi:pimeloyl-ACP methyl ester carboxylesterase